MREATTESRRKKETAAKREKKKSKKGTRKQLCIITLPKFIVHNAINIASVIYIYHQ